MNKHFYYLAFFSSIFETFNISKNSITSIKFYLVISFSAISCLFEWLEEKVIKTFWETPGNTLLSRRSLSNRWNRFEDIEYWNVFMIIFIIAIIGFSVISRLVEGLWRKVYTIFWRTCWNTQFPRILPFDSFNRFKDIEHCKILCIYSIFKGFEL